MKERDVQRRLVELLHEFSWATMHVRPIQDARTGMWVTTTSARGWPDVVALRGQFIIAVEVKGERGKLTQQQLDWLQRFAALPNGRAWCVTPRSSLDELARWLAFPDEAERIYGWLPSSQRPVQRPML